MAQIPPTLVSYTETTWNVSSATLTTASISWQTGDVIVAIVGNEGAATFGTVTAAGLTFTNQKINSAASTCNALVAIAIAASNGSGTVSVTVSAGHGGIGVWVWRGSNNANGVGASFEQHTSAMTVNMTPLGGADSAVVYATFDFGASALKTVVPTATHARQRALDSTHYSFYVSDLADQVSAGAVAYGLSGTVTAGPFTIIGVEIKGTTTASIPGKSNVNTNPSIQAITGDRREGFIGRARVDLLGKDSFFGLAGNPNYDWPNPMIAGRSIDLRTFINPVETQLIGKDQFFAAPGERTLTDFPNPIPPRHPMENKGFVNPVEVNLLGKDQFFGAPGQPPANNDWPNPLIARRPVDLLSLLINLQQYTLFFLQPPFSQSDWPNPLPPKFASDLRTYINALRLQLAGQDQFFGAPGQGPHYDYPNPLIAGRSVDLRTIAVNLLQTLLVFVPPPPFNMLDWPNPLWKAMGMSLRTHIDPTKLNLLGQDVFFGAPGMGPGYDYPNPLIAGRSVDLRTIAVNLFYTLLNFVPPPPFNLLDWPNPLIKMPGIALRTHTDPTKLNLLGQDRFFAGPGQAPRYDYPNPLIPRRAIDLNTIAIGLTIGTLYILYPFTQDDWPNPIIRPVRNDLRVFSDNTKVNLLGQDQFFGDPGQAPTNRDWPLPGRYPFPVGGRTHTQTGTGYLGKDKFFGAAGEAPRYDYPNPLIKPHVVVLKTHLDTTRIKLIDKDQFFGAPGERNLTDFPNPLIKGRAIDLRTLAVNLMQGTLGPPAHIFRIAMIDGELYAVTGVTDDAYVLTAIDNDAMIVSGVDADSFTAAGADDDSATVTGIDDDSDLESE